VLLAVCARFRADGAPARARGRDAAHRTARPSAARDRRSSLRSVEADGGAHRAGLARYIDDAFVGRGGPSKFAECLGDVDVLETQWKRYVHSVAAP
jgi:hypothetical protein